MHFYRWLAALRHKATSPLFPVYNVWGFLFSVSLHWLVLWFCIDALDRPCAKMKRWSFSIFCSNQMWFNFAAWVKRFFSSSHYFLSSFCHRFEEIVKKFKVEYHAGGATQNSVKIAQVCLSFFFLNKQKNGTSSMNHSSPNMSVKMTYSHHYVGPSGHTTVPRIKHEDKFQSLQLCCFNSGD